MKVAKLLVGFVLMPLLVALGLALWDQLVAWIPTEPWRSPYFWSVWGGGVAWLLIFLLLPRPVWMYVLGHEMTHALAAYLAGGKVYGFKVSSSGGHILTDKSKWWITLSPYFIPFYSLIWAGLWLSVNFYYPLKDYQPLLYFGLGFSYAFHISFTLSMIHPQQSDLKVEGYVFSYVTIACTNLILIWMILVPINPAVSWKGALFQLGGRVVGCYWGLCKIVAGLIAAAYKAATAKA